MTAGRTLVAAETRRLLACDRALGGGNAFDVALRVAPAPDAPYLRSDTVMRDANGVLRDHFSLTQLASLVRAWSAWHAAKGVGPRDRVGIHTGDALSNLVQFLAISRLGAIAVPVNGDLAPSVVIAYLRRIGPVGLVTDDVRLSRLERDPSHGQTFWTLSVDAVSPGIGPVPDAYPHAPDDPVLLCHTSGTTGTPKAVIWTHSQMMEGIRNHLVGFRDHADSHILSALPPSHGSALGYALLAMLTGVPLTLLAVKDPESLVTAVARHRASVVVAFAGTLADVALVEPADALLSSVERWVSVGDASHHAHVARLVRTGRHSAGGRVRVGSMYVDGFGSSELGWGGVLSRVTVAGVTAPPRCIGTPLAFAEVAVLRSDGTPAGADEVGLLGVKGRTVTPGYWNDSDRTVRSRLNGYWLTGDLVYRDAAGRHFHVDRVTDAVDTAEGPVYSTLTEEIILACAPEVRDCVVVAGQGSEASGAVALLEMRTPADPSQLLARINDALAAQARTRLTSARIVERRSIPTGVTGKVLKRRLRDAPLPVAPPSSTDTHSLSSLRKEHE